MFSDPLVSRLSSFGLLEMKDESVPGNFVNVRRSLEDRLVSGTGGIFMKARLLGVVLIVLFAGLIYMNWNQLNSEGTYSMKLAAFGPVGVVGGIFLLLFPGKAGKPETTKDKIVVLLVFAVGLVAGLFNWYLMDPGFFGR